MAKKNPTKQKAKSTEDLKDLAKQMRKQNDALQKLLVELKRDEKYIIHTKSQNYKKQE